MDAVSGQPNTFDLPLNDIRSVPEVRSASAAVIPAGEYTISISYRDTSENPSATASITGIPITNPVVVVTPTVVSSGRSTPWTPITPGSSTNSSSSSSAGQGSSHEKYHFPRTLKQGMKGDDVVILQNFLKVTPVASKHFGPKTKAALIDFQRTHGLTADGIAGPKTFAVIESMI
jgi:peptidoglycan hydrolase-like protein with peptidoglycan-binding domain